MLTKDIQLGMQARVKIGDRLAVVTVERKANYSGGRRQEWFCRTHDTGRMITATAARLRPMPGTPENAAAHARRQKAAEKRCAKKPNVCRTPADHAPVLVAPAPVPGMFAVANPARPVERMARFNHEGIARILGSIHVGASWRDACRAVFKVVGKGGRLRGMPLPMRRGCWQAVAEIHADNLAAYREVMGHKPLPTVEMIAAAMRGDEAARRAVLAG
jgi:hypothetical protein